MVRKGCLWVGITVTCLVGSAFAQPGTLPVGETEQVYLLGQQNRDARGLACSAQGLGQQGLGQQRLYVLDRENAIFAYRLPRDTAGDLSELQLEKSYDLTKVKGLGDLVNPRGLLFAVERGHHVFYFLDWYRADSGQRSLLWRYDVADGSAASVDLTRYVFRIGDREPLDVASWRPGRLLVSFDASGYADQNLRVRRGIIEIELDKVFDESPRQVRHLPDAGTESSRGLTCMELDGAQYLWGTVGDDYVYCAEAATGRGLFYFPRPDAGTGLAFGDGSLWVAVGARGADRVARVNVTGNLDAFYAGPRVLRRLVMTLESRPEESVSNPGAVYHYYSRPAPYDQLFRQGVWPETETLVDLSKGQPGALSSLTIDPAGDASSRQVMPSVEYANAPAQNYTSRYEIDMWTSPYRAHVYPHRVDLDRKALRDTDYLADDPDLYNLSDAKTYTEFVDRVESHIQNKYGVDPKMENPYWAARNVVEYIQDSYYYPNRAKRKPATVDYARKHYDANPGNLKIELSNRPYDKSQIIACSGTSVMVAGAMRHLGIPARWLGTGTPESTTEFDTNANGLLDGDEMIACTNGHRYSQVWLGSHYGWICFDATPTKPPLNDYDPPPPLQSQWRYMTRAAGGHRKENRIVFNVGSQLIRQLYRDFRFDEQLAIDNNCGGDQRYNLQGRFEDSSKWKLSRQRIKVKNLCFVQDVTVAGPQEKKRVTWKLEGPWDRIPDATFSLVLQHVDADGKVIRRLATVATSVAASARSTTVDLSAHQGKRLRVTLRRNGDPLTGGRSEPF